MSIERKSGFYAATTQGFHFELRLDADGEQPQNQASVTLTNRFPSHWIAEISPISAFGWEGSIWFRNGSAETVTVNGQLPNRFRIEWQEDEGSSEWATLTFLRDFQSLLSLTMSRESDFFRTVEFEIDNESGVDVLTSYDSHDHPRRPADLPAETLSLESSFNNAGVKVTMTTGANVFDISGAGPNQEWNESELHDAMLANCVALYQGEKILQLIVQATPGTTGGESSSIFEKSGVAISNGAITDMTGIVRESPGSRLIALQKDLEDTTAFEVIVEEATHIRQHQAGRTPSTYEERVELETEAAIERLRAISSFGFPSADPDSDSWGVWNLRAESQYYTIFRERVRETMKERQRWANDPSLLRTSTRIKSPQQITGWSCEGIDAITPEFNVRITDN